MNTSAIVWIIIVLLIIVAGVWWFASTPNVIPSTANTAPAGDTGVFVQVTSTTTSTGGTGTTTR